MQDLGFWFINDVIWHKKNPTPNFKGTRLNNSHETLIWAVKSEKSKYCFNYKTAKELNKDSVTESEFEKGVRKQLSSVWRIPVCQGYERLKDENGEKLHNTQKPEEILYRVIAISSKKDDLVLDPFGGTMTTAAMAKKLGRNFITIDESKKYCEYGKRRLENIEYEDSPISNAEFDIKPIKVTFKELVDNNLFHVGEKFYLKDNTKYAILLDDAKVKINNEIFDIHSGAAKLSGSKSKRLNGFSYWFVYREDKLVSIDKIRNEYREIMKSLIVES